jgi:hypothetical protein
MSIATQIADAVGLTSVERISELGHALERLARAIERQVAALHREPLTLAQHLGVAPVVVAIDFRGADTLLAEADRIVERNPDAVFTMRADPDTRLDDCAEMLRHALATAEPFRRFALGGKAKS